jgi:hypothetical protein
MPSLKRTTLNFARCWANDQPAPSFVDRSLNFQAALSLRLQPDGRARHLYHWRGSN